MTTENFRTARADEVVKVRGQAVRIIADDSDPRALIWGCLVEKPDTEVWFYQHEIEAA